MSQEEKTNRTDIAPGARADFVLIRAEEAAQKADAASELADRGPAPLVRDAQGRMGMAYQSEAAEANRQAGSWMRRAALKGMPNAKERAEHYTQRAERHLDLVPVSSGGRMDATPEYLASLGLRELEETLKSQPPPGVTGEEVSALLRRNWQPLTQALVGFIKEAQQAEVGPWVVLARVEKEQVIEKHGRTDLGEAHKFKEVDKPVSLVWGRGTSARNLEKAQAYADKEGYMIFTYPPSEEDPLKRAKLDAQAVSLRSRVVERASDEEPSNALLPASSGMIPTVRLRNGREVLAKLYKGELTAMTYANSTQAYAKAQRLGAGWTVSQFTGRPFFVVKETCQRCRPVGGDG